MKTNIATLAAIFTLAWTGSLSAAPDLASGVAKGTYAAPGEKTPATLTNATAFVDEKDDQKPILVILSDKKLPTEKWTSEFDLMENKDSLKFSGVIIWIDPKDGSIFRSDTYWKGQQASVSGYFEFKLDPIKGKDITGSAHTTSTDADAPKLDATFHATLK
jgi:hypothetical protein